MPNNQHRSPNNDRGLTLFFFYVLLYGGFIAAYVLRPDMMSRRVFNETIPFSVAYGMILIFSALILALLYLRNSKK